MGDEFREGPPRLFDPLDECPGCHTKGKCYAVDLKILGKKKCRSCSACLRAFVNGKDEGAFTVFPFPVSKEA